MSIFIGFQLASSNKMADLTKMRHTNLLVLSICHNASC